MSQKTADSDCLRFRILGPLEHRTGDSWMPVKAAKQRALLALLLLNANRIVGTDQLIDELWGDEPPSSAPSLVAGYVWRLRRALNDPNGTILNTRSPGYLLAVRDDGLDAKLYESLVAAGRRCLSTDRPDLAVDAFDRALRLWRDAPMADVPLTATVMAESARLEESRLAVAELRTGTLISLGRDEELLPELKAMVAQNPLRERLHGYLMIALYRAGQQADALGAYRDLRRLLIDELGVEPSRPLQELQRSILQEDERLLRGGNWCELLLASGARAADNPEPVAHTEPRTATPAVVSAPAAEAPAPATLPGRDDEVRHFAELIGRRSGVFAVRGGFGTGKSAFALAVSRAIAHHYPDGQLYLDLSGAPGRPGTTGPRLLATVSQVLGRPLAGPLDEPHQLAAQWQALTTGRRLLLVLDHIEDPDQVRAVLTPTPFCSVLITGPSTIGVVDAPHQIALQRLSARNAVAVLAAAAGTRLVDADRNAAAAVAGYCEYLPLALRAAALQLAARPDWSMADLAHRLSNPAQRLNLLSRDEINVRESLNRGVRFLHRQGHTDALAALGLLASIDLPVVSLHLVAALLDCPVEVADKVVGWLMDSGLVEPIGHDRYRVSHLLRLHAAELFPFDQPCARRVVDSYLERTAQELSAVRQREGRPGTRHSAIAWFRRERPVLETLAGRPHAERLARCVGELKAVLNASPRSYA